MESTGVPSGTITFLFSDVVGSTLLWATDPEAMSASLRVHDQIFTEAISKVRGQLFPTAGDSFAAGICAAKTGQCCWVCET